MTEAKIPMASAIDGHMDEDGCLHLVLLDEKGVPIAGVIFTLDGAIDTVEQMGDMIDDYLEDQPEDPDTIGPCMGRA